MIHFFTIVVSVFQMIPQPKSTKSGAHKTQLCRGLFLKFRGWVRAVTPLREVTTLIAVCQPCAVPVPSLSPCLTPALVPELDPLRSPRATAFSSADHVLIATASL